MNNQTFDNTLIKLLERETLIEKWKKKPRIKGEVIRKKITKKGSFMFTIKTTKLDYDIVVPKHRKNEFELAKNIHKGDFIKVTGERNMDVIFCDRIQKLSKNVLKEKQIKLLV